MVTIYECSALPLHWVVEADGRMFVVPAVHNGWQKRTPYRGYRESLRKVSSSYLIGLGVRDCDARGTGD